MQQERRFGGSAAPAGAAAALTDCDHQDLDGDGCSDFGAAFTFPDGSTASLLWLSVDGEFVCQEEFSQLPGDPPPSPSRSW